MKIAMFFVSSILFVCWGLTDAFAAEQRIKPTGTFSNLEYNAKGGDLLGMEIKIVATRKGFQGALQIAEGGPSEIMVVDVKFEKDNIRFEIPSSYPTYGGGVFDGKIDSKAIKGRLTFKDGGGNPETLPRKASYWDK